MPPSYHLLQLHVLHSIVKIGVTISIDLNCKLNFNICFNIDKVLPNVDDSASVLKLQRFTMTK
jgi:hypothetical protein